MNAKQVAADVPWLAEVQTAPAKVPRKKIRLLAPVLKRADGSPVRTLREWTRHRQSLRADWMRFLGPMPARPISAAFTVLGEERLPTVVRQLVRYEVEAGQPGEAYLLRPRGPAAGGRPGVVALHQTTRDTIEQIAGVKGPAMQQIGLRLAERGFVVICPRNYLWQDVSKYLEAVDRFRKRHPGSLGMHKMLYDSQRAVDILAALPEVDSDRIGATGHSLGGKETLYLAAFDERVVASVASEGGVGFRFTNWNAPWYLGKGIDDERFPLNHHQLLALSAPRAFLVLAGENTSPAASDGDRTWPFFEAAFPAWRLYGDRPRLGLFNHRRGHSIPPIAFSRMVQWLSAYLGLAKD
ncbi:MAG: dienelactone hydrolase family protein [Planctomycetaceae bacterium]|jgi:dienelactone hydrolase|nr:dienelactone hydrolase family protein [Planctomycetaceae bacterium]